MAKQLSRAVRASNLASELQSIADQLREIEIPEKLGEKAKKKIIEEANEIINSADFSEIENLSEEMVNWRDGMSGTNLENTEKYSRVDEAASTLEGLDTSVSEISDIEEIEEVADTLENIASELENIDFPGMYG